MFAPHKKLVQHAIAVVAIVANANVFF